MIRRRRARHLRSRVHLRTAFTGGCRAPHRARRPRPRRVRKRWSTQVRKRAAQIELPRATGSQLCVLDFLEGAAPLYESWTGLGTARLVQTIPPFSLEKIPELLVLRVEKWRSLALRLLHRFLSLGTSCASGVRPVVRLGDVRLVVTTAHER
jgi:hypothetical protein